MNLFRFALRSQSSVRAYGRRANVSGERARFRRQHAQEGQPCRQSQRRVQHDTVGIVVGHNHYLVMSYARLDCNEHVVG